MQSEEKKYICYFCGSDRLYIFKGDIAEGLYEYQCKECKTLMTISPGKEND